MRKLHKMSGAGLRMETENTSLLCKQFGRRHALMAHLQIHLLPGGLPVSGNARVRLSVGPAFSANDCHYVVML